MKDINELEKLLDIKVMEISPYWIQISKESVKSFDLLLSKLKNFFKIQDINIDHEYDFYTINGKWLQTDINQNNVCSILGINTEYRNYDKEIQVIDSNAIQVSRSYLLSSNEIVHLQKYLDKRILISTDCKQNIILSW